MTTSSLRERAGCWLYERWQAELVLRAPGLARTLGLAWQDVHNRSERLQLDPITGGRVCEWQDSSRLTVARIFPDVGTRLLRHALQEWPVRFAGADHATAPGAPDISILIPIAGQSRMAQFRLALATARAQIGVNTEVVVVEQWPDATLRYSLPSDVRYLHQIAAEGAQFNKSKALNAGARAASGRNLIILDADYVLPERFAAECAYALENVDAVRSARWIFYLDRTSSERLATTYDCLTNGGTEAIVSNNPTPLALRRSVYWEIGGHDEAYEGWGGEDTEFLDRLRIRPISEGGWMPVLHAWHAPAPKKADGDRNRMLHEERMAIPVEVRIARLRAAQEMRSEEIVEPVPFRSGHAIEQSQP
ncbi:glycosyltransferase family 2 protein [Thermomonas carbonis]|uniref:Uncharacterized protein n=1 Tax=Thermomonas carbonis TaxID=1463158 RepID=A0A7G9SN38_9GAMM|nr:galactosyltransferase-related protein [Thermomonas carbonis]QNN69263.1 hypothetical protein H9L16_11330 [Thermomonas carbonis]GHC05628.1 hypothetical protein GCM10010080_19360 [Thermomonas carbonis]